ncbi:MAG: hypothetical protein AB1510_06810 [Bacillota bacterium]
MVLEKVRRSRLRPRKALVLGVMLAGCFLLRLPSVARIHINEFAREINRGLVPVQYIGLERLCGDYSVIYYPKGDERAARLVFAAAEQFFPKVAAEFGLSLRRRVPVVIYKDQSELNRFFGWPADEGTMGVYWAGTVRVLSPSSWIAEANADSLREVFFYTGPMVHEAAHLMVDYRAGGNYPRWLTEGLAQETERRLTGFTFDPPESNSNWYSLKDLERFDYLPDQRLAYYQSLLMVQYLFLHGGDANVFGLLNDLGQGSSFEQALARNTGCDLSEFETKWREWAGRKHLGAQLENRETGN